MTPRKPSAGKRELCSRTLRWAARICRSEQRTWEAYALVSRHPESARRYNAMSDTAYNLSEQMLDKAKAIESRAERKWRK